MIVIGAGIDEAAAPIEGKGTLVALEDSQIYPRSPFLAGPLNNSRNERFANAAPSRKGCHPHREKFD